MDTVGSDRQAEGERAQGGQAQRMRAALAPVITIGPDFLAGRVDADQMTSTMVQAAQDYAEAEGARGAHTGDAEISTGAGGEASDPAAQALQAALAEVHNCGTGYRAGRCESDCVARTMTELVHEFGDLATA